MALDNDLTALAHRLADRAGDILRRTYRQPLATMRKEDASPVTQADREVEESLRALIEQNYPDHGIVGEEFGTARDQAALQWVIDPIDGTRSFIGGYPLFTTLIAVAENGASRIGVIDQPIQRERWVGVKGKPTLLNGNPVKTRSCPELALAVIATTSIDYFKPEQLALFMKLKSQCAGSVLGGDAYAYAMLACGQTDIVIDAGLKNFDFMALVPVIEGAGGTITDWAGKSLTLHSDGRVIAAGSSTLHRQALASLI